MPPVKSLQHKLWQIKTALFQRFYFTLKCYIYYTINLNVIHPKYSPQEIVPDKFQFIKNIFKRIDFCVIIRQKGIDMNGLKQFGLEIAVVNVFIAVILMVIVNLVYADTFGYDRSALLVLNLVLAIFFVLCLMIQNVYFRSIFYFLIGFKIKSNMKRGRLGIFLHNLMFTFIYVDSIVVAVCEVNYFVELAFMLAILCDIIPCFMKKCSQILTCYLFKIETVKFTRNEPENEK